MTSLVAFASLPGSRSGSFSYGTPIEQSSKSNPSSPGQPVERTWKSCNSAIAPRQTFPLGQQHVPLTSIPTLGHALLEGKQSDIDYVNVVLQRLASCRSAHTEVPDEDFPAPRSGRKGKRKHRIGHAEPGRVVSSKHRRSSGSPHQASHIDDRGRRHSVDYRRFSSDISGSAFSPMAVATSSPLSWSGLEGIHDSMSNNSKPELSPLPSTPVVKTPDAETVGTPGETCETEPCPGIAAPAEIVHGAPVQQVYLDIAEDSQITMQHLNLSGRVNSSIFNTYNADALMEGEEQAAADWFDSIFGDDVRGEQGLLQDEALSQLLRQ